jgi:adenylate cyclase
VDKDQITVADYSFAFRQPEAPRAPDDSPTKTEKTIQEIKTLNCWLLVADIEASTQFTKRLPADEVPRVTGRWLADCKQIIDEHGGTINKFLGDGFLAYWLEREPTATAVAKTLGVLREQQDKDHPRFRVVLHYGKVFVGGAATLGEESLLGNEVNFVFRMEKLAGSLGALRLLSEPANQRIRSVCPTVEEGRHTVTSFEGEYLFFRF